MGHHHHHHHHHSTKNIGIAFFLNFGFCIIELFGGLYTNSIAILSDALHDFGDSLALGMAWYFQNLTKQGSNSRYHYGYGRFSVLGAFINCFILIVGSAFVFVMLIPRLLNPPQPDAQGMFFFAIFGVLVNGAAIWQLRKGHSLNERAVALHLLEDVLGWVAVLVGSILMYFFDIPIIDPILALLIALYIVYNVWHTLKEVLLVFLQQSPKDIDQEQLRQLVEARDEVAELLSLRLWTIDQEHHVAELTLRLKEDYTLSETQELRQELDKQLGKEFHIEYLSMECIGPEEGY